VELFSITCPTCNARLKVRDMSAIGQILNCPKCASMVEVAAPAGWQPPDPSAAPQPRAEGPGQAGRRRWENEVQPGEKVSGTVPASASSGGWSLGSSSGGVSASEISSPGNLSGAADQSSASGGIAGLPAGGWTKWALVAGMPVLVVTVASIWFFRTAPQPIEESPSIVQTAPDLAPVEEPSPTTKPAEVRSEPEPVRLARRWLPTDVQAIVSLRPRMLWSQPAATVLVDRTAALWQPAIGKLAAALGIEPQSLKRVTWSTTDVAKLNEADWLTGAVLAIELDQAATDELRAIRDSEPLDWKLAESPVRELKSRAWPQPFAFVDKWTLVTGPEAQLRALAAREEPKLANAALGQILDELDANRVAISIVDLRALHAAEVLPHWLPLVDVLHADADDWQLLRTMPLALGLGVGFAEKAVVELELACDGKSSAEQVQAAFERVLAAVESTIGAESESLTDKLMAGQINAALAAELKHFLAGSKTALAGAQLGTRDAIVWARFDWQGDLPKLASGFLASVPQLEASRLAAAGRLDEEHHRLIFAGLGAYAKAEGGFPAGVAGASLLPPDTRLSWQATLLPYLGHLDWHGELSFARAWNDPMNARVARRPLELMVNPALGPGVTKAGFPVTHYVGMAGLGADAGQLDADDPRAGVFGFRPRFAPVQIPDGASNTIVLAGVSQKLGAWARGGDATVRGLTQRPYINGPDGFGSGQPDGMLVAMADGSVRFLPKDIDPAMLEQLVTIGGGDSVAPHPLAAATRPKREGMPAAPPKARAATKPQPKPADVDLGERLGERIASIELKGTTLSELADLLSQLSTIPITLDARGLAAAGVETDAQVSLNLTDTTVADILDEALRSYGLKYIQIGDQLVITDSRETSGQLDSTQMNVGDLAPTAANEANLARMIEAFVSPTAWQASGGAGSLEIEGRSLKLEQTAAVTTQVADFLDKLRLARDLPPSRRDGRRLSLDTRWAMSREKLATSVTANFAEPARLKQIVAHFEKSVGIEIVFDGLGMAVAGASPATRVSFAADRQPLSEALEKLLKPLQLGYRRISGQRIEITAARQLAEDLELEFFPVKSLLADGGDADELAARLRKEVSSESWRENGGSAVLTIDGPSSYLIVLAPQPVQTEIELWLGKQ
jgi:hypothetical protein